MNRVPPRLPPGRAGRGAVSPNRRGAVSPNRRGAVSPNRRGAVSPNRVAQSAGTRENLVKDAEQQVGVLPAEHEGRADLEHVAGRPGGAEQDPAVALRLGDLAGAPGRGPTGLSVLDKLDTEQQARAAHIPDEGMPPLQLQQAIPQVTADLR